MNWWRHVEPLQGMWRALHGLSRYIVTPTVAKHRLFVWLEAGICPDHQLIVIARDDDVTFGILHSRFHEVWSLRLGTWLGKGNDPTLHPDHHLRDLPFPGRPLARHPPLPITPTIHAASPSRTAARRLVELRDRWLSPPEWVDWVGRARFPGYPKRPVARNETAAKELKGPYADKPVQCPPAMARRCPRFSRCCGRSCVRMGRGRFRTMTR